MTQLLDPPAHGEVAPAPDAAATPPPSQGKRTLRIVLEVALISAGVFLGLAGDQWRENASHRELSRSTLRRFRAEVAANRQSVAAVHDYRVATLAQLRAYLGAPNATRNTADVKIQGLQIIHFEQTAWDLAIATQALVYIDPELAADLSRIYSRQARIGELNRGITQAMYNFQPEDNFDGVANAVQSYFGDLVLWEPELVTLYDAVLPRIDRALGTAAPKK